MSGDNEAVRDAAMRAAAFTHVQRLGERHTYLTRAELAPGFLDQGERVSLVNPQRGIFKPRAMPHLLSIRTVYPRAGARVGYDDQRHVHQQLYESEESVDYAFMGRDPNAADNRWLREAHEREIPLIDFLGIATGRHQALLPVFVTEWNARALTARIAFGVPDERTLCAPQNVAERRYALRPVKQRLHQASFREAVNAAYAGRCAVSGLPERRLPDAAPIECDLAV